MALWSGKPVVLGATCGISMAGFNHHQLPDYMPTYTQIAPFRGDPRRNVQARPPVSSDASKSRATCAKPPNGKQKRPPVVSRHLLTSTRLFHPIPNTSKLALRTLRNRSRDYERTYQRQIGDGRPDETWVACGASHCTRCTFYDRMIMYNLKPHCDWREEIFVELMEEVLSKRGHAVSRDDINSFIQSPPIQGALWEFQKTCGVSVHEVPPPAMAAMMTGMQPAVVHLVRAPLIGEVRLHKRTVVKEKKLPTKGYLADLAKLRRGGRRLEARAKTKVEVGEPLDLHMCFAHYLAKRPPTWKLEDYLLQFCVVAESWRRYGLQRGCRWGFGGAERAADLICAVLLNWWTMTQYDCFKRRRHTRLSMNLLWEEWMERSPRFLQGNEMEEEQGSSSEEVFQGVGRAVMLGISAKR